MNTAMPPRWVEGVLRIVLAPRDRQTVSGDLLEEYRESVHPARGRCRPDLWYVPQVAGFVWRDNRLWAVLLGGAFVTRTAVDWLAPPADFSVRSTTLTFVTVGVLMCAGFRAAWRSRSVQAGPLAGTVTSLIAAAISSAGAIVLLAMRHDSQTLTAIDASGGLAEVFALPLMLVVPCALLGALGGLFASAARRLTPRTL
jgi:hypothetical protein